MMLGKKLRRLCAVFTAAACMTIAGCGRGSAEAPQDPIACIPNSDNATMTQMLPDIAAEFNKAAALPLTGKPVTDVIANPANDFETCTVPAFDEKGTGGKLVGKTLQVLQQDPNRQAYLHEMFHGVQTVNGALSAIGSGKLSIEDGIEANMLVEASAVGYTFTVYKEMSKTVPDAYDNFTATGYSFKMRPYFDEAYDKAMKDNAQLTAQAREEKALEAGGKAVVDGLLTGANPSWAFSYAQTSAYNNARKYSLQDRDDPAYQRLRADYFRRAGAISPTINITPDELVSPDASRNIIDHLAKTGSRIEIRRAGS